MEKRKDTPQKAAMREFMNSYLKESGKIRGGGQFLGQLKQLIQGFAGTPMGSCFLVMF